MADPMTDERLAEIERLLREYDADDRTLSACADDILRIFRDDLAAAKRERDDARAEADKALRGAAQLGHTIEFMTEMMRTAVLTAGDGAIASLRDLACHLSEADALAEDEADRVHAALDERQARIERLAEQAADVNQVQADRDHLAEQMMRLDDLRLIRLAINDPGAFVPRGREDRHGERIYEPLGAWGARAVVTAIRNGEEAS